ncbi:MAG: hypothetical protein IE926_01815 [Micrococcales bacterium]|nr:hypothetical protein [Micrococcales bacterium]
MRYFVVFAIAWVFVLAIVLPAALACRPSVVSTREAVTTALATSLGVVAGLALLVALVAAR